MPFEDTKILESNQYLKSDKAIKKIDGCKNNLKINLELKSKETYSIRFFNVYDIFI